MNIKFENIIQWVLPINFILLGFLLGKSSLVFLGIIIFFLASCFDKIPNPFKKEPKEIIPVIKNFPSE